MRTGSDGGFTLVELLVTISLLAVVMGAVTSTMIGMQRQVAATEIRYEDLGTARTAINAMQQTLRAAIALNPDDSAVLHAEDDHVRFYSNVFVTDDADRAPKLVEYEVDAAGVLTESVTNGDLSTNASGEVEWSADGSPRVRTLARNVDTTQPLLTYYGDTVGPSDTPLGAASGLLPPTDLPLVHQVLIDIRVDSPDGYGVEDTQLRNRVRMPNAYVAEASE